MPKSDRSRILFRVAICTVIVMAAAAVLLRWSTVNIRVKATTSVISFSVAGSHKLPGVGPFAALTFPDLNDYVLPPACGPLTVHTAKTLHVKAMNGGAMRLMPIDVRSGTKVCMTPDRDYLSVYVSGLPTEVEFGATVNGAVTINGKVCRNTTIGVIRLSATNGLRATASLDKSNVSVEGPVDRFGESVLSFSDIDGLTVEIIRIEPTPAAEVWTGGSVPADATLRGFHTATISQISHEPTERTLRETMGFRLVDREDNRFRYAVDSGGAAKTVDILCAPGAAFGQVAVGTVHHIAWRTPDDANEPGMKSTELGFTHRFEPGTRPETLLMLHGTGGDENDMVALGRELLPGAAIISPRGKVLENGMPRFFRGLAMGVFDVENLRHNTAELAEFIRRVAIAYELQAHSILTVGYSNGANIAASLLLLHPEVLAGAVLFRPMVPLVPDVVPILNGIPVLIAAAHQDPYAGEKETERLSELLKGGGADVKTQWVPGGHGLTQLDIDAAKGWLGAHFAASEQNTEAR